jgi:hypothetical protein
LRSNLTSASAAIPAFRPCLPSRCLARIYTLHCAELLKEGEGRK